MTDIEAVKKAAEEIEEALKGIIETFAEIAESILSGIRESGFTELLSAAYVADALRENPRLDRIEAGLARATRIRGDRYLIETTGPKQFKWKGVIK